MVKGIICELREKCNRLVSACNTCKNNTGERDYYEPATPPPKLDYGRVNPWLRQQYLEKGKKTDYFPKIGIQYGGLKWKRK